MRIKILYALIFSLLSYPLLADSAYIQLPEGGYYMHIEPEQTLAEVAEEIKNSLGQDAENQEIFLHIALHNAHDHPRHYVPGVARDYYSLTQEEYKHITDILLYLGSKPSAISLAWNKSEMEAKGEKIRGVHPLKWLLTVFMEDRFKVAFRNIYSNGLIWSPFITPVKQSLMNEDSVGNLYVKEHIKDFASKLNIQESQVAQLIKSKDWDGLIALLMAIPRTGDYERYRD